MAVGNTERMFLLRLGSAFLLAGFAGAVLGLAGCGEGPLARPVGGISRKPVDDSTTDGRSKSAAAGISAVVSESAVKGGLPSPEAVFEARKRAKLNNDYGAMFDTDSPQLRDHLVLVTANMAALVGPKMNRVDEINRIFEKYGVDESKMPTRPSTANLLTAGDVVNAIGAQQAELLASITDKRAFYIEMSRLLQSADSNSQFEQRIAAGRSALAASKLAPVHIVNDMAIGYQHVTIRGREAQVPTYFIRIDGSWYFHEPTEKEKRKLERMTPRTDPTEQMRN